MAKGASKSAVRMLECRRPPVNTDESELALFRAERRVREIQTKLHRWARDDPHRRFDDLFNLVVDPALPTGGVGSGARQQGCPDGRSGALGDGLGVNEVARGVLPVCCEAAPIAVESFVVRTAVKRGAAMRMMRSGASLLLLVEAGVDANRSSYTRVVPTCRGALGVR